MAQWSYFAKAGDHVTFNSARFMVPREDIPGPVVLDATASQDFVYELLGKQAVIVPAARGARSYANVTLHVARTSAGLGKGKMGEHAKDRFPRILDAVSAKLSSDPASRSVLFVCHKQVEHIAQTYETPFKLAVGHWGALDGRNDWQDFDTCVIAGLSFRDTIHANNLVFALTGLPDQDWFSKPTWSRYADVRDEIEARQLAASIVQAINRVRCRKVIDGEGNCQPTDVFILLPASALGDRLLQAIETEMPGIRAVEWDFELEGQRPKALRKNSSLDALVTFMGNAPPGEYPLPKLRQELGVTGKVVEKWQEALRSQDHPLPKKLAEHSVVYQVRGTGRGAKSYLIKTG